MVECDISALTESDDPFAETGGHPFDQSAKFRVRSEWLHALADRTNRALRGVTVLRGEEAMQARDVVQCRGCPDDPRHESVVRLRWFHILASFQFRKPGVGFRFADMQSGRLIFGPGVEYIPPKLFATFFAVKVLLEGLSNEPFGWPMTLIGQAT